jgi:alpha-D-xyloside xylohydrolase
MTKMKSTRALFRFAVLALLIFIALGAQAQWRLFNSVTGIQQQADGVLFTQKTGQMKVQVCNDSMLHILYSPTASFPKLQEFAVNKTEWPATKFTVDAGDKEVTIATSRVKMVITRESGNIVYKTAAGDSLLTNETMSMAPVTVNGEQTYHAEAFFNIYGSHEGVYGLGQHQAGVWNYRGASVDLSQENSEIAIPLLVSSKGWGVFWNNSSRSKVNNRFANYMYVSSEVADVIDYYFIYGPEVDQVVSTYRELTGSAPMFGKWAYGFWQCKNRYSTQEELLGVAHKYRELHIPMDNIVQDWFWWVRKGEHKFNPKYPDPKGMVDDLHKNNVHLMISIWPYFEPGSAEYDYMDKQGWFIDKFKYDKQPYHAKGMAAYDASSAEARKYYWDIANKNLFQLGVDAWWMDTVEPETEGMEDNLQIGHKIALGSGNRYANLYPLLTTEGVYKGQREASSDKRVYILARSAFAGSQRNAASVWSGDVVSDWVTFKRQIPAGLNYAVSGMPYWTTDIGGFTQAFNNDPAYRELWIRWFQFGTFNPILRVHGGREPNTNELWSYGPEAQKIAVSYDRLRYRLMPYIYSLAWKVTSDNYTIMRPLVFDFRNDQRAINISDQFMFGPALLVNPVTEPSATSRSVYLPKAKWYDFWSGKAVDGGAAVEASAPIERLPLFVRAGSIVPMGPDVEWASQKAADPIELRVYRGADGSFTLYEDENDNYNYEKGVYATIPVQWDEAKQTLTIGARKGKFPGMLEKRTFHVVFAGENHGAGSELTAKPDKVVSYSGEAITVKL